MPLSATASPKEGLLRSRQKNLTRLQDQPRLYEKHIRRAFLHLKCFRATGLPSRGGLAAAGGLQTETLPGNDSAEQH